jgi:hypothetical protein
LVLLVRLNIIHHIRPKNAYVHDFVFYL